MSGRQAITMTAHCLTIGAMRLGPRIVEAKELPRDIGVLLDASLSEGFDFVDRLVRFWEDGSNRFDRPGEILLQVRSGAALLAVGGLNVDPYIDDPSVGRLRHVYVLPSARGTGVGSLLVRSLVDRGFGRFDRIRLRVGTPDGGPFYEALGFVATDEERATHEYRW